ncbi:MAG: rhodanese-like domain-containing protein [Pirellulaceae bacterium]
MSQTPIEIDVAEVKRLLDEQAIVLIDCREADEWNTAKIDGAVLLPMSNWAVESQKLSQFDRRLVVHCHHGGRSLRVTRWLRENGFPDAQNMTGGIHAWSEQVDSQVPQY